jgi:D-3-phosphoglycerate dehydrogenase
MRPEILMMGPMMQHVMDALDEAYVVHRIYEADDRDAFLADIGASVRAIATDGALGVSADVMKRLPGLEIVSCYGVGTDAIDLVYARDNGVRVTNTPDVLNDDVANMAIALLLATSRRIVANDSHVRTGKWLKGNAPLARGIRGKPVGILGLGRIGKNIAGKLEAFGCEISYHGRSEQKDQPYRYFADLVEMAAHCDYVIVICPGGAATNGIVTQEVCEALGPDGTLINVARGSVVDQPALVNALVSGKLGGAGLDVFADEPNVPEELLGMDNVVLQPHAGSGTVETRRAMGDLVIDNLALHFAGEALKTPVV